MKCFALLLLLFIISLSCFAQEVEKKKMPVWKKQVLIGSAITVGGAGALTASVFSFQAAFKLLDEDETVPGIGALVGSCVLAGAG
ncbi:MAG TPA: hypothetical protein VK174_15445, partial [Chitinophagales bacterium]|nr:hypothetical protein [Chitinophagales bacterium]